MFTKFYICITCLKTNMAGNFSKVDKGTNCTMQYYFPGVFGGQKLLHCCFLQVLNFRSVVKFSKIHASKFHFTKEILSLIFTTKINWENSSVLLHFSSLSLCSSIETETHLLAGALLMHLQCPNSLRFLSQQTHDGAPKVTIMIRHRFDMFVYVL
jgi:hypothetical protein